MATQTPNLVIRFADILNMTATHTASAIKIRRGGARDYPSIIVYPISAPVPEAAVTPLRIEWRNSPYASKKLTRRQRRRNGEHDTVSGQESKWTRKLEFLSALSKNTADPRRANVHTIIRLTERGEFNGSTGWASGARFYASISSHRI